MRATQTFQNKPTDHTRGIMKLGNPTLHTGECSPYWGQASSRKHKLDVHLSHNQRCITIDSVIPEQTALDRIYVTFNKW